MHTAINNLVTFMGFKEQDFPTLLLSRKVL